MRSPSKLAREAFRPAVQSRGPPTWKSAIQQVWKPALRLQLVASQEKVNDDDSFGRRLERYTRKVEVEVRVGKLQRFSEAVDEGTTVADKLSKLFGSWQKTVGALVALIGAIGLLAWKLGLRKAKPAE